MNEKSLLELAEVYGFKKLRVSSYPDDIIYLVSEKYDEITIFTKEQVFNIEHRENFDKMFVQKLIEVFRLKTPMQFLIEIIGSDKVEQILNTTDYKYVAFRYSTTRRRKYFELTTGVGTQLIDDVDIDYTKKLISYDFGLSSFHSGLAKLYRIFDGLGYEVDAENAVGLDDEGQNISDWWEKEFN